MAAVIRLVVVRTKLCEVVEVIKRRQIAAANIEELRVAAGCARTVV